MILTALDFVDKFRVGELPEIAHRWNEVFMQAIRHTRGFGVSDLLDVQRPHESEYVKEYRLANIRHITKEGAVKFNDKSARIIKESNYNVTNVSADLSAWIDKTDFLLGNGDTTSLNEWFARFVLPSSYEDPNAILVAFPYNPSNPSVQPSASVEDGGLLQNESIAVIPIVVPSCDLWYVGDNVFSWRGGFMDVKVGQDNKVAHPWFFICDRDAYYQYLPVSYSQKTGRIVYELFLWYRHDTGMDETKELPLNILGGTLSKDTKTTRTFYESFMQPFFEYGDEALIIFSDWQSVRVRTAFPVRELVEQPCKSCGGQGKTHITDPDKGMVYVSCSGCSGKGYTSSLSPFDDIIVDSNKGFDNKNIDRPSLRYISPPLDAQQELSKDWKDMRERALKSINLDLLEATVESGEAKKQRLQDLQDMLLKIGGNMFDTMERLLWHVECLLVPNRANRQMPVIIVPISYDIKTEEMLRDEAIDAHTSDRFTSIMQMVHRKYAGDTDLIRVKELALMYAPLLMVQSVQELQLLLASGAYNENDLIKRDRVESVLIDLSKRMDLKELSNDAVFALVDAALDRYLKEPVIIVD